MIKINEEKRAEIILREANAKARQELDETDWYFLRALETGKPMPAEIKTKRQAARERLSDCSLGDRSCIRSLE